MVRFDSVYKEGLFLEGPIGPLTYSGRIYKYAPELDSGTVELSRYYCTLAIL